MKELNHQTLHHIILEHVVRYGYAPSVAHLAQIFGEPSSRIIEALQALEAYHGAVLHPHNSEIWVIHPFSMAPTNFLIRKGDLEWWGNCAWCSLGAAWLLGGNATITTTLGANGKQVALRIQDGRLLDQNYYVHFPIPMVEAWGNVVYTCSMMLLFETKAEIYNWSDRHNLPRGDIQPVSLVYDLARAWYGNHLDRNWKKWSVVEARHIFKNFNLNHSVWEVPASDSRF